MAESRYTACREPYYSFPHKNPHRQLARTDSHQYGPGDCDSNRDRAQRWTEAGPHQDSGCQSDHLQVVLEPICLQPIKPTPKASKSSWTECRCHIPSQRKASTSSRTARRISSQYYLRQSPVQQAHYTPADQGVCTSCQKQSPSQPTQTYSQQRRLKIFMHICALLSHVLFAERQPNPLRITSLTHQQAVERLSRSDHQPHLAELQSRNPETAVVCSNTRSSDVVNKRGVQGCQVSNHSSFTSTSTQFSLVHS